MSLVSDLQECIDKSIGQYPSRYDFWFQDAVKRCMEGKGYTYIGTRTHADDADDAKAWKKKS